MAQSWQQYFFPLKRWTKVDPMQVKGAMQAIMQRWGRPQRLRMDNGMPWGTNSKLPSAFGLWLVGLGVDLIYGRPARSTDNAVVERCHGVLANWAEPECRTTYVDCEARLAWAAHTQRERYRLADGQTRLQKHPALLSNPRTYDPQEDSELWSLDRVRQYLRGFIFQRKVELNGRITLFANTYSLGRPYARQYVEIQLDPQTDEWVMRDEYGKDIRRHPVKELSYEIISQLNLAKRRKS